MKHYRDVAIFKYNINDYIYLKSNKNKKQKAEVKKKAASRVSHLKVGNGIWLLKGIEIKTTPTQGEDQEPNSLLK